VMRERGVPRPVGMPGKQDAMPVRPGAVPEAVAGFESPVAGDLWPAGEGEAQRRLKAFVKRGLEEYKRRRDNPGVEGTSTLSPFLAAGAVSVRQCLAAAMGDAESPEDLGEGAACWVSELVWREFYIHVMAGYPRVCMHRAFLPATERVRWRDDPTGFEAWCLGRTGIPMVDAGMRQLEATGWMHNRVRMVTAMFLTKNLLIDWRRGEQWFMRHLVDWFLASNNGGWQWSASTGTDAAPYFRVFNPVSQGKKFDPEGEYVRRWVPELRGIEGAAVHEPWELPPLERGRIDYPGPIVDLKASRQRAIDAFAALA
jgi:deoxyribodipyrimidine photo-lyase